MTTQILDNNHETLFSFELLVEYIRINKNASWKSSKELALGVRLLDFPTLLIYQPVLRDSGHNDCEKENRRCQLQCDAFEYAFNKGKSCLFKINLNSLHTHLSNTPLYAMVLDMNEDVPKLIGTSLISLAKLIDGIRCDVEARGISIPSSQGEKAVVDVFNLMGEKIGLISMGYKLLSLGASLLPHIPENRLHNVGITTQQGTKNATATEKVPVPSEQRNVQSREMDYKSSNVLCQDIQIGGQPIELVVSEAKQRVVVSTATQTEHAERKKHQTLRSQHYNAEEEDPALLDPPPLFYSCPAEQDEGNETDEYKLLNLDLESLRVEDLDLSPEDETPESEMEGPLTDHRHNVPSSSRGDQQTHDAAPSVLGEALRQLPLLNALLIELSQLNGQSQMPQQQPLSIHPNLAWIYRPVAESPAGPAYTAKSQTKPLHKVPRSPRLLSTSQPLGNCTTSTPQRDDGNIGRKRPTSPPKRLVYGITKTFSLRMKRVTPGVARRHECVDLFDTQRHKAKGKQSNGKIPKCINKTKAFNRSAILNENIDTLISSIGIDSAQSEATSQKSKSLQDSISPRLSKNKSLHSKKDGRSWVRIPSAQSQQLDHSDDAERGVSDHSDLNKSEPGCDSIQCKNESPSDSSRCSRRPTKQDYSDSRSNSSVAVEEYADDFTSLDPTDGYSPDPLDGFSPELLSSPEPILVKTRRDHASSDDHSSSDGPSKWSQRKVTLPVPVKAHKSPQRSLRGTHIIRPRTQASALSVSSDNSDGGGLASICSLRSRNQQTGSSRAKRPSVSESVRPSMSQSSDLIKEGIPVRGCSMDTNMPTDSISSPEPHEAEEVGDELGSLGFKNRYQHVSELVANKLPGYTL